MRHSKNASQSLYELLAETALLAYYSPFITKLKIENPDHLKYVAESDLSDIGMSKPEQRRLMKALEKRYPNTIFGKFKKRVFVKVPKSSSNSNITDDNVGIVSLPTSARAEQHIIPSSRIILCQQLGGGEFGDVWQGIWSEGSFQNEKIQVAVKCIPPSKMVANPLNFVQEAAIMHKVDHENIVRMFGVVLEPKSIMLVTELAPMRSLLECLKQTSSKISFPVLRLCDFAQQICNGMTYLESNRLIHRDLAARNILVFSVDRVKVSDFGLSRALGVGEDYYRGNFGPSVKLPIAWCAPECIRFLKFTSASDVWSFGITLWEMFTYGFQPWVGMTGHQILEAVDKPNSQRLEIPDDCPLEFYNLMLQTWEHEPGNRPKFAEILTVLPEIRPEQVKAVFDCCDGQLDHLQYKAQDVLTVLSNRPPEYPDGFYWKGVLSNGRTGLFAPSNTVSYLSLDFNQFNKASCDNKSAALGNNANSLITTSSSSWSMNSNGSGRSFGGVGASIRSSLTHRGNNHQHKLPKDKRFLISRPENDFRHTAHVGLDGSSFGDVSLVKTHLPLQIVNPLPQSSGDTTGHSSTCCLGRSQKESSVVSSGFDSRLRSTTSETAALISGYRATSAMSNNSTSLDLDAPVFESNDNVNLAFKDSTTLLDDVLNAWNMLDVTKPKNSPLTANNNCGMRNFGIDISEPSSPTDIIDQSDNAHLLNGENGTHDRNNRYNGERNGSKQQATVKPLSASETRMLNDLTMVAAKIADKALSRDRERQDRAVGNRLDEPESNNKEKTSPTAGLKSKFSILKFRENSPLIDQPQRKTFCDSLPRTSQSAIRISPEAENAYKSLIDGKSTRDRDFNKTLVERKSSVEPSEDENVERDENPLRMLRNDGTALVRSFRAGSSRRADVQGPVMQPIARRTTPNAGQAPPIPPKTFKTTEIKRAASIRLESPSKAPPPIPPKPKFTATDLSPRPTSLSNVAENLSPNSNRNPKKPIVSAPCPAVLNYSIIEAPRINATSTEILLSASDECPPLSFDSVDKYQLLNFVLSPLRANEQTNSSTVPGQ